MKIENQKIDNCQLSIGNRQLIRDTGFTPLEIPTEGRASATSGLSLTGFTLVEILVALGIMSIVLTMLFQGFYTVFKGKDEIDGIIEANRVATVILDHMAREISQSYISPEDRVGKAPTWEAEQGASRTFFLGENDFLGDNPWDSLRFTTTANRLVFPVGGDENKKADLVEIYYYLLANRDGETATLMRRVNPFPEPGQGTYLEKGEEVADNILGMDFTYYDEILEDEKESWDSMSLENKGGLPRAVGITLSLQDYRKRRHEYHTKVNLPMGGSSRNPP